MSEQSERSSNGSEDRSASQENESGRKRRPRSSLGERNFVCGCAKEYLSYPALYTHVRNKHDGIFPIGSYQKKKIPKPVEMEEEAEIEDKNAMEEGLVKYLGRILPGNLDSVTSASIKDGISIDYMIDNITANQAKYSLGESSIKPFLESLNSIRTKESRLLRNLGKRVNDRKLMFSERKESPDCNTILAYFAAWVASKVAPKNFQFVRELVILMQMIRTVLNKHGQKYIGKSSKQGLPDGEAEFCSGTKIGVMLYLSSLFISELFPVFYEKQRQIWPTTLYFGDSSEKVKNLIFFVKLFADWLRANELVDSTLQLNIDN